MDITGLDDNMFYTRSNMQASSNITLPSCELSVKTIYSRCGCDNLCVLMMAVLTPAMLLALYMVYCTTHMLLVKLGVLPRARPTWARDEDESARCAAADAEFKALSSIQALPSHVWGGRPSAECSLCLQPVTRGDVVRRLHCRHIFRALRAAKSFEPQSAFIQPTHPVRLPAMRAHPAMTEAHDQSPPADLACIDRWLVHGQSQHPTRACPLCRRDPLLAVNSASAGEGEQDGLSDDEEGTRSGHGARVVSSAALAVQRGRIERRVSEGSPRRVIGLQARRCSDSVAASAASSTQLILL